jgi:hypothetical protein
VSPSIAAASRTTESSIRNSVTWVRASTSTARSKRAIVVALGLRFALRAGGPPLLDQHWSGPPQGARLIKRLAFGAKAGARPDPRMP